LSYDYFTHYFAMLFRQTAIIMVVDEEPYWEEQILQLAFMAARVEAV
jgi:hypothetical protein